MIYSIEIGSPESFNTDTNFSLAIKARVNRAGYLKLYVCAENWHCNAHGGRRAKQAPKSCFEI